MERRPYQLEAVASVERCFAKGYKSALTICFTGGGKTILAHDVIKKVAPISEKRTLFLVSWQDLVRQTRRAFTRYSPDWAERKWTREGRPGVGIVMGEIDQPEARVVIGTPQTLGGSEKKPDLSRLNNILKYGTIDLIVIDECFPSGTLIGGKPIEQIKVGDMVTSFDQTTKTFVERKVAHLYKRRPTGSLVRITYGNKTLVATENHPIYTQRGWVNAGNINAGDSVLVLSERHNGSAVRARHIDLLQLGVQEKPPEGSRKTSTKSVFVYLQRLWQSRVAALQAQHLQIQQSVKTTGAKAWAFLRSQVCGRSDVSVAENAQRDVQLGQPRQDDKHSPSNRTSTEGSWWQWSGDDNSSSHAFQASWGGLVRRIYPSYERCAASLYNAQPLQDRLSQPTANDSHRNRRRESSNIGAEGTGSAENVGAHFVRLDAVEIFQPTGDDRFGGLLPDGYVYNFEVEGTHTYTANGVVVHNCHRSVTQQFVRIIDAIRADNQDVKIAGYTATPWREDGLGLNNIFEVIACNYNLQYAIMNNYACQIRDPLQIETHVSLPDGLDTDEEMAKAIEVKNWAEIVLKGYLEHGENRLALAFMPSVEHSRNFAKYAQSQGIECTHVDSEGCIMPNGQEMGTKQRYAIYEWYASEKSPNKPRILTNYNILTTGFDCPPISCLIWARPSKSDLIFVQALGRGTRLDPSKEDLLLLDYVVEGLKLVSASTITGLALESNGETAEKEEEQIAEGTDTRDAAAKSGETYVSGKGIVVRIGKLIGHSKNSWHSNPADNTMSLACGDQHTLFVVPPFYTLAKRIEEGMAAGELALERNPDSEKYKASYAALEKAYEVFNNYTVWRITRDGSRWKLFERPLLVDDNPMSLFDRMAPIEDQLIGDNSVLTKKHRQWRRKPASEKQLELLRRLRCFDPPTSMGNAAQMISHFMVAPKVEKYIEELRRGCRVYGVLDSELRGLQTA